MLNIAKKFIIIATAMVLSSPLIAQSAPILPANSSQVEAEREWPDATDSSRSQGVFIAADNIQRVTLGLRKSQVYALLDVPHFSEGIIWPKRWNYLINFYTGNGSEFVTCQFQITYGRDRRVDGTYWRTQECQDMAAKRAEPAIIREVVREIAPAPVSQPQTSQQFVIHFPHDGSLPERDELYKIDQAAAAIVAGKSPRVTVVGMADTSGAANYNTTLANRRAENVASLLQARLPANEATSLSVGRADKLRVDTPDGVKERANRVVTIIVD